MITIRNYLANILMKISKYGYSEPIVIRDTNVVMVKAMSTDRTTYFITRVRTSDEVPEKMQIDLNAAIINKNVVYVKDIIEDIIDIPEPEVELKTTLIARTNALIDVLENGKYDPFSTAIFKPNGNKLVVTIRSYYEDITTDYQLSYGVRVLEGDDIGMFRCLLLHRQLRLLKSLGVSTIKIRYTLKLPMLITPYGKEYPRLWIAPYVGDE